MAFLDEFFEVFMPRQVCMRHEPDVVWLHVVSDTLIALAYFSIPMALVYFVRRRNDLAFNWMFLLFAAFIMACGLTHVFGVIDMWAPVYRLDGVVKLGTGIISAATAILLWQLIPTALALPSPAQLRVANEALAREVTERRTAQEALARLSSGLEERVQIRTRELDQLNQERQQLLVAEKRARNEAEQANRLKDDFVATLSHELRTPVAAILGWVTLLGKAGGQVELQRGLEVIERNVRMQQRLIDDLLDTNRIVAGKMELEMLDVDLRQVIAAAVDTLKPAADARQIHVNLELGRTCTVSGDAHRLQQVVGNLLSNAIKFTPQGGRINIVLTRDATDAILAVRDDGEGIDPDFLPYVFERFRQADPSTSRRVGGLGLGLAIVKQLVEMHGGQVGVSSAGAGRGAEFLVRLPLIDAGNDEALTTDTIITHATSAGADVRLDGMTLLVVDDEADVRDLAARVLTAAGASVRLAASAAEALALLDSQVPDLLLSDIGMPGMDGLELIRRVRAREAASGGQIPAIALTAFGRVEDRTMSLEAGYQLHLVKPVEVNELLAAVAGLALRAKG